MCDAIANSTLVDISVRHPLTDLTYTALRLVPAAVAALSLLGLSLPPQSASTLAATLCTATLLTCIAIGAALYLTYDQLALAACLNARYEPYRDVGLVAVIVAGAFAGAPLLTRMLPCFLCDAALFPLVATTLALVAADLALAHECDASGRAEAGRDEFCASPLFFAAACFAVECLLVAPRHRATRRRREVPVTVSLDPLFRRAEAPPPVTTKQCVGHINL